MSFACGHRYAGVQNDTNTVMILSVHISWAFFIYNQAFIGLCSELHSSLPLPPSAQNCFPLQVTKSLLSGHVKPMPKHDKKNLGGGFKHCVIFAPIWRIFFFLTNLFQRGWFNHQLVLRMAWERARLHR